MKNLALSLIALAAISTSSLASQRSNDLREQPTYFGKYSTQCQAGNASQCGDFSSTVDAFAAVDDGQDIGSFARLNRLSQENSQGRH
jgi:hypothetical protein